MRENALIQFSSGRYYQGRGVLQKIGEESALLGHKALIVVDDTVWKKTEERVRESLRSASVEFVRYAFSGGCTEKNYTEASQIGQAEGCTLVIGMGGGRAIDTAKIAADLMGVRCITVPTSLATCASTAWLSVHYREDGSMIGNYWTRYSAFCTLVDLDVAALDCPQRYTAAGILDAMSKYPEITYNLIIGGRFQKNAFSETAALVARHIFDELLEHGESCLNKLAQGLVDEEVENCAAMAVDIAGITSVMACGGKQAAVCHLLYAWICGKYPDVAKRFVHGEIVAASMIYQLILSNVPKETVGRFRQFIRALHAPSCLQDLGILCDEREAADMLEELYASLGVNDPVLQEQMRQYLPVLLNGTNV